MDVMLAVELVHPFGVEKDECNEYVNGTLLREPKAEFVAANLDAVERFNQDDSEQVRNDANSHEPQVRLPVTVSVRHVFPLFAGVFSCMRRRI
jgi:hypothetical protein